jgi:two-component system, OmpR family, KDP operon response regulator KdpE
MYPDRDTILIIDDEAQIRRAVSAALSEHGARVLEAGTATEGIELAAAENPDLFVLDLGLPDRPGIEVCRELRRWSSAPIVVLSARHAESEKVALLRAGADDYVCKPFGLHEFAARVEAQLRRARTPRHDAPSVFEADGLTVDLPRRAVRRGTTPIRLTPTEWSILQMLAIHAGRTVTHQEIFDTVWGREFGSPSQYLRVYVTHLRRKIERNPGEPRVIITEPGVGYRLEYEQD